jgi:hypothetical protein
MAFAKQSQQDCRMGEQSDRSATWSVSSARWSQQSDKRTVGVRLALLATAMATGASRRRAARDDIQQSVERVALQTADCLLFAWWGLCVEKHWWVKIWPSERHRHR